MSREWSSTSSWSTNADRKSYHPDGSSLSIVESLVLTRGIYGHAARQLRIQWIILLGKGLSKFIFAFGGIVVDPLCWVGEIDVLML